MTTVSFDFAVTPPSLNVIAGRSSVHVWRRHKKRWQTDIEVWLLAMGLPRGRSFVEAEALLRFPQRRHRDINNYDALLNKSIGDALVNGRWIADDTPAHYRFAGLAFDPSTGPAKTTITLRTVE